MIIDLMTYFCHKRNQIKLNCQKLKALLIVSAGTTFRGHRPIKIWECKKNVKKSVQFTTTFESDRKYFWNE